MKKNNLKKIEVNELGIVTKGANDRVFAIYKSADFMDETDDQGNSNLHEIDNMENLKKYGTSEGTKAAWDTRGRGQKKEELNQEKFDYSKYEAAGVFDESKAEKLHDEGITPDMASEQSDEAEGVGGYKHTIGYKFANGDVDIKDIKRKFKKSVDYMTDDKIKKSADEQIAELKKSISEKDALLVKAASDVEDAEKKKKEAAAKMAEAYAKEEEVEEMKKSFVEKETIAKAALERVARLEDIAKAETIKTEVRKSMGSVAGVTTDDLATVVKVLDERQLTKEEVATIKKALTSSSAIIEKSLLFKELGSSRGDEPSDPLSMANAYADSKIAKADGPVTSDMKAGFRAEYWDAHPDQYAAYISGGR